MPKLQWLIWLCLIILLVACGQADDNADENDTLLLDEPFVDTSETPATDASGYPQPVEAGYPAPDQIQPYPGPSLSESGDEPYPAPPQFIDESKRASLNQPVIVGQQTVSGSGPAGIPIKVVSISYAGEELGFATILEDSTFEINLSRPVEEREVLGLLLAEDSLRPQFEDAPGTDMPMIGFVLDQVIIEP